MLESILATLMCLIKESWYKFIQCLTSSGKLLGTEKYTLMKFDENKNTINNGINIQVPNVKWFRGTKFCMDPDSNEESSYRLLTIESSRIKLTDSLDIMMETFHFYNNLRDDTFNCSASYLQPNDLKEVVSYTSTTIPSMTFQVLSGSGKYKNARIAIFNYDNISLLKPRTISVFS